MNTATKVDVSKLVVVDMPPIKVELGDEFQRYIDAMRDIDQQQLNQQKQADRILQKYESDLTIRQFLLTNLKKDRTTGIYQFRIPYDILQHSLHHMGDYFQSRPCHVPTLFITGGRSPYHPLFLEYHDIILQRFPHSSLCTIEEAGHWVQTEQPQLFLKSVTHFIH